MILVNALFKAFFFSPFFFSCSLCAAINWPVLHKKSTIHCHGNGLLGFLGGRGGVWKSPCCEHVDQVCCFVIACGHLSLSLLSSSVEPFHAGMILRRCCVQYSGRTATLTCCSTFLALSLSVYSSPLSSSSSAPCWGPLATIQTAGNQLIQLKPVKVDFKNFKKLSERY